MDSNQFPQNETNQPCFVSERPEVVTLLQTELGLPESSIEDLERVIKAASDKEGRVGPLAPPGSGMREAHSAGTEHLNRMLTGLGWCFWEKKHLRFCVDPNKRAIILYQNVHEACNKTKPPINISPRGAETEDLVFTPKNSSYSLFQPTVWFLCTSFKDGALKAELSKPNPFKGSFNGFSLRLCIYDQGEPTLTTIGTPVDNSFDEELGDFELPLLQG